MASLSGVDTHGVWHLEGYVKAIKADEIVPTTWPEIVRESPTSALISGNWTFGHVVARYAMEVAMRRQRLTTWRSLGLYNLTISAGWAIMWKWRRFLRCGKCQPHLSQEAHTRASSLKDLATPPSENVALVRRLSCVSEAAVPLNDAE